MHIKDEWLGDPSLQKILRAFTARSFSIFCVGGCVRNSVLGVPISDVDLATDARPDVAKEIAESTGFKVLPTGIEHGTITVVSPHSSYEITTFRQDVVTDGRHAEVAFSTDIATDAGRRDFTMNALYCDAAGHILDPLNGMSDLQDGRVRFIGSPQKRISEDYLRILRFFRFTASYGNPSLGIDADGLAACAELAAGLDQVSKERIGSEFLKMLSARDPSPAVASMQACGVLPQILPGADVRLLPILVHLEERFYVDPLRRLALIGGEDIQQNLRLSNHQMRTVDLLRNSFQSNPKEVAFRHGYEAGLSAAILQATLAESPISAVIESDMTYASEQKLPISAQDLMPAFSGKALGDALLKAQQIWIASDFEMDRETLLKACLNARASDAD